MSICLRLQLVSLHWLVAGCPETAIEDVEILAVFDLLSFLCSAGKGGANGNTRRCRVWTYVRCIYCACLCMHLFWDYAHAHTRRHTCTRTRTRAHTHTHIHTYTYTPTRTHPHTHYHSSSRSWRENSLKVYIDKGSCQSEVSGRGSFSITGWTFSTMSTHIRPPLPGAQLCSLITRVGLTGNLSREYWPWWNHDKWWVIGEPGLSLSSSG